MKKIIVIAGPTGVGKTKLSVELAKLYDGEIINADSVQVYKRLNIGSAKIKEEEKEGIPHHLFDIKDPEEDYNIFNYQKDSRKVIDQLLKQNKTPILVGGSGLYIKACLYNYDLEEESKKDTYENLPNTDILDEINKIDKNHSIHVNNRQRLVRQLNKLKNNDKVQSKTSLLYDVIFIGLTTDRETLYARINNRVDTMFKEGLLKEVESLYMDNINTKAMLSIGYKELYKYFDNEITLDEAKELIKRNSRRYAKRQFTWFNNQMDMKWFEVNIDDFDKTIKEVNEYIKK